ncbi:hypothetical protein EK21DRAFT_103961 [Setomelanomma holmii]|uniref:Uncharacterized protein n=1 Tax=Setomelanomma holmii TaxID=210430 RepID=A0A9P4H186_9PLEO|nr:hypothetical protein EK21DRAFT_103961 [Setomelanomma holmii]
MFGFSGNLLAGQHDTKKRRPPPSRPIPITFPSLQPPEPSSTCPPGPWITGGQAGLSEHFLRLKKPTDVTRDTLELLNVTFETECEFETLLSSLPNEAQSHLPPKDWFKSPEHIDLLMSSGSNVTLLSNGRRKPDHNEFFVRARELFFSNDDAFSTLTRKGSRGQAPLRLAHFRKFWEGLDNMAYYWDNSLDEYGPPFPGIHSSGGDAVTESLSSAGYHVQRTQKETEIDRTTTGSAEVGNPDEQEAEPRKKAKVGAAVGSTIDTQSAGANGTGKGTTISQASSSHPSRILPARTAPSRMPWLTGVEASKKPVDLSQGSYRGYRIGNGAEMPDQYRIDCIRAFLEPLAWAFGVTLSQHRRPPVLTLENVRFPVRMSSAAWRGPQDRAKARQGWMEGPLLGMQCRSDVNFGATGNLHAESVLDTVRELGGLLLLAQERAREGKTEKRSGDGKWWTTKERWGGGPGGEVGDAQGASDAPAKDTGTTSQEKLVQRNPDGSKVRRRPTTAEIWKILRPGQPQWDPKIVYEAIGKDRSQDWDDVFMVSSLNHHISVLRLRVHPLYLQYLTEGSVPDGAPKAPGWCSPKLRRTRWYDLFNVDDRTEAMRGIWGIMSYTMR